MNNSCVVIEDIPWNFRNTFRETIGQIITSFELSKIERMESHEATGVLRTQVQLVEQEDPIRLITELRKRNKDWKITLSENWIETQGKETDRHQKRYKLFVGQIDKKGTEAELYDLLASTVDVKELSILPAEGKSANYGFLIFNSKKEAEKCIEPFDHHAFKSKNITVK